MIVMQAFPQSGSLRLVAASSWLARRLADMLKPIRLDHGHEISLNPGRLR